MEMIRSAAQLAHKWHAGQKRRQTGRPYIEHPGRVATRVMLAGGDEEMISAAWLHDVLEDTKCPASEIVSATSLRVLKLVEELTNPSKWSVLPRKERKQMDRLHLAAVSRDAKLIKLADRSDNLREMAGADEDFKKLYVEESRALLRVIGRVDQDIYSDIVTACLELEDSPVLAGVLAA